MAMQRRHSDWFHATSSGDRDGFRCPVEENLCQAYGAHRAKAPMVKVPALPDQAAPPLVVGAALGFNPEIQPLKTGFRFSWKATNPSA
jgi:hypothetical protein